MGPSDGGIANDDTLAEDEPRAPAPLVLGGYEVGARIGAGGMGEVRLARDPWIGRDVAVKQLARRVTERGCRGALPARGADPGATGASVDRSGARARRGQGRLKLYFAMKRLTGVTLAQRLGATTADTRALLNAFVDVCAAIDLAHTRQVVHRDLKPANIMLGDFREVYVLDWGVARVLGESDAGARTPPTDGAQTQVGTVIGTPLYMAPEQARGEVVGAAADVFALGAILFEILAREPLRAGVLDVTHTSPAQRRPGARSLRSSGGAWRRARRGRARAAERARAGRAGPALPRRRS